jgi:hypothetical protein
LCDTYGSIARSHMRKRHNDTQTFVHRLVSEEITCAVNQPGGAGDGDSGGGSAGSMLVNVQKFAPQFETVCGVQLSYHVALMLSYEL